MEYTYTEWHGFRRTDFTFEDREALVITPACKSNGRWMIKMEYFGAYPALEVELLKRGWHLAYIKNLNRWGNSRRL